MGNSIDITFFSLTGKIGDSFMHRWPNRLCKDTMMYKEERKMKIQIQHIKNMLVRVILERLLSLLYLRITETNLTDSPV